jgi:predicted nucleic acid-binding protein
MNERTLIDTSAWVKFFRRGKENSQVADEVELLLNDDMAFYTEPVYLELLVGAKVPDGIERLKQSFLNLPLLQVGAEDWQQASQLALSLRESGLRVDIVDLVVAATAISNEVTLFHHDKHFRWIAGVSNLRERSFLEDKK